MTDISTLSASFVGPAVPWVVQAIRDRWLPWSGKAALWLSLAVSAGCTSVAYFSTAHPPTAQGFLSSLGVAFTLSQVVFHHLEDALKGTDTPAAS